MTMLILPTGGKGTGPEASGSNFPFVQPSPDIVGLLADLWLSHDLQEVVPPLRVTQLTGFQQAFEGQPSAAQITIVDSKDATIFDSPGAVYHYKPWGRLWIHEWLFSNAVCRVVQHCATSEPRIHWPDEIAPINGVLDERTSEVWPERLLFLSDSSGATVQGSIQFNNGYNVDIATTPYAESLRNSTLLTFKADPGGGQGRSPGCQDPSLAILRVNGVGPDPRGNLSLAAGKCYYIRQPIDVGDDGLAVPEPATLALGNDCDPCCDCDSFVNVQKAILNVEQQLRDAATLAEATRDEYTVATERWNAQKECRESQAITITASSAASLYVDINVLVCNVTAYCLVDMQVDIAITIPVSGSWSVVSGTAFISQAGQTAMIPYQLVGPWTGPMGPTVTAHIGAINPQSSGRIKFRIVWNHVMPAGTMLTIAAEATVTDPTLIMFPQSTTYTMLMT